MARYRLTRLERRRPQRTIIATRWHDADYVHVNGTTMPLAEYERLYPDAIEVNLTWGDPDDFTDGG